MAVHDSRSRRPILTPSAEADLFRVADRVLAQVGDVSLGEWWEVGEIAIHVRRRLAAAEWGDKPWGMDYRGTPEGDRRLDLVRKWLPDRKSVV